MTWNPETKKLERRYHALYGMSQTLWVSSTLLAVADVCDTSAFGTWVGFMLLSVVGSFVWRWSWRRFRAAFMAETNAEIETLKREYQRFLQ